MRRPRGKFGHFKNGSLVSLISATPWSDVVQWYTARIFHNHQRRHRVNLELTIPPEDKRTIGHRGVTDDVTHNKKNLEPVKENFI